MLSLGGALAWRDGQGLATTQTTAAGATSATSSSNARTSGTRSQSVTAQTTTRGS